jgi:SecD/SecF fusion protein
VAQLRKLPVNINWEITFVVLSLRVQNCTITLNYSLMQNKSAIWVFTVLMVVACLYQISFSFFTGGVEDEAQAEAEARVDSVAFAQGVTRADLAAPYRDSLQNEFEDNYMTDHADDGVLFGFNYQECKDREMKLGLDLQGGMNVVLEVSLPELIENYADNSSNRTFVASIALARDLQSKAGGDDFITLFERAWNETAADQKMAAVFHNRSYKDKFPIKASNDDIIEILRAEAEIAIASTEKILRTRIDKFGVTQPTIARQGFSGRILIELPGVKDPKRVRKILQSTANLEFWATYNNYELDRSFAQIDSFWRVTNFPDYVPGQGSSLDAELAGDSGDPLAGLLGDSTVAANDTTGAVTDTAVVPAEGASVEELLGVSDSASTDTGALATQGPQLSDAERAMANPLYSKFNIAIYQDPSSGQYQWENGCRVGAASERDIDAVNAMLNDPRVQQFYPEGGKRLKLMWHAQATNGFTRLYAIKAPKENGGAALLTGEEIIDARQDFDPVTGGVEVILKMNGPGAEVWKKMTGDNVGKAVVISLDNTVYSAPMVQGEISGGSTSITMGSQNNDAIVEAKDLANILKAGSLPAPANIVDEAIVGPTLGAENVTSGMWSFIIALSVVLAYMIFYYAKAGIIANVALLANIFFLVGTLASLQASLTLPGIAGIVLTIGMSVDANVLIYERIREEIRAGKGIRLAITDGYKKAYAAILDANITTLLTGIILFAFGSGPIKGFATTLIIGICTSLFSAIFITRLIFMWQLEKGKTISFATKITKNWMTNMNIGWIRKRKIYYLLSGLIVVAGIVSLSVRSLNFGVDFTGGRTYKVEFTDTEAVNVEALKDALVVHFTNDQGLAASTEVKTIKNAYTVKVTTNYMLEVGGPESDGVVGDALDAGLSDFKGAANAAGDSDIWTIVESRKVDATISDDIKESALWAVIFSIVIIFLYILLRFRKWQFGLGALIAMTHDVLVVLAVFSLFYGIMPFSMEVDQAFIAAILTVVGYSINDTVVVFDRIREYLGLYRKKSTKEVVDAALNSTLSRTLNTSLSTFVVLLMIFILGGDSIKGFVFALMIGVVVGTYSSLCIATPAAVDLAKDLGAVKKSEEKAVA